MSTKWFPVLTQQFSSSTALNFYPLKCKETSIEQISDNAINGSQFWRYYMRKSKNNFGKQYLCWKRLALAVVSTMKSTLEHLLKKFHKILGKMSRINIILNKYGPYPKEVLLLFLAVKAFVLIVIRCFKK